LAVQWFTAKLLQQDANRLVANTHTLFNITSAVVFLPLTKRYARFIEWVVPLRHSAAAPRPGPRHAA
jgi:Na+/phosphate symporter